MIQDRVPEDNERQKDIYACPTCGTQTTADTARACPNCATGHLERKR